MINASFGIYAGKTRKIVLLKVYICLCFVALCLLIVSGVVTNSSISSVATYFDSIPPETLAELAALEGVGVDKYSDFMVLRAQFASCFFWIQALLEFLASASALLLFSHNDVVELILEPSDNYKDSEMKRIRDARHSAAKITQIDEAKM